LADLVNRYFGHFNASVWGKVCCAWQRIPVFVMREFKSVRPSGDLNSTRVGND